MGARGDAFRQRALPVREPVGRLVAVSTSGARVLCRGDGLARGAGVRGGGGPVAPAQRPVPQQGGGAAGVAGRVRAAGPRRAALRALRAALRLPAAALRAAPRPPRRLPPRPLRVLLPRARLLPARGPGPAARNQLPRKNDTYSYDPPPETPPPEGHPPMSLQLQCGAHLCRVCGCLGPKTCSKCHRAHYCSKDHQTVDWKLGHKLSCVQSAQLDTAIPDHKFLFPEYEIVIESEEMETPGDSQTDADTQKDLEKHEELEAAGSASEGFESLDEEVLEAMAKYETREDKIFQKFKNRIAAEPEQILRYCRGGEGPVWISGENIPQMKDIPNCSCGAQRMFEFQVMPQLLNHLKADSLGESIDWGTLVVYTCAENCNQANGYMEEFIWKQDIPANST
ncbi:programmed cell death protein 2 isoform X2 [Caretta caretta]|uniref:programmed cell death protein 2 isoform X2 n=1 Tax=Caretta caretta TaxID=8467 RepID=UPI003F4C5543